MNPFFRKATDPIPFDQITTEHVTLATSQVMEACRKLKQEIIESQVNDKRNRLVKMDDLDARLDFVLSPLYLMKDTHPDDAIRLACHEAVEALFNFDNELSLDEDLYQALKAFSETEPQLDPVEARLLQQRMDRYMRNGFRLDKDGRAKLKVLDEKLNQRELHFQKNIAESEVTLLLEEAELDGLPEDYIKERREEDGRIRVTTQYPDYYPLMKFATRDDVRKKLYLTYLQRAKDKNIELLDEIIRLRVERIKLLGFETYASYQLENKMAHDPETVWQFVKDLSGKVADKATSDYKALCDFMGVEKVDPWAKFHVTTLYKKAHFDLNDEEVKNHFPLDRVLDGLFMVASTLYRIQFKKVDLPRWHDEVLCFEISEQDKVIGRFYLDLFPRLNKYGHAACFSVQSGKLTDDGYQMPSAALVCNFPKPTSEKPSLLSHGDVETFFHEFGHLMHQLLTTAPFYCFSGTSVARDFVEMPSQIFENWVWEKEILQRFARHYLTGEPISDELIDKMLAVKHLNSGIDTQQQLFYCALDMNYHDGYQPEDGPTTTEICHRTMREYTLFEPMPDTCLQAAFGHLIGYSAGYYGYQWSKVYAQDMYSVYKEHGILDAEVGKRFRNIILAKGDSEDPMELIKQFLGREPRMDAFLQDLGV